RRSHHGAARDAGAVGPAHRGLRSKAVVPRGDAPVTPPPPPPPPPTRPRKRTPELFLNRELPMPEFHARVLEEAHDPASPLLERLKYATIVASNLDEFFMVRVAGLQHRVREGDTAPDAAGMTPGQQLAGIAARVHGMVDALYQTVLTQIIPALEGRGLRMI